MGDIYYNFSQYNDSGVKTLLSKTELRSDNILDRASDYDVSIVKFNLPSTEMRLFKL
jgi:hypothetical protein